MRRADRRRREHRERDSGLPLADRDLGALRPDGVRARSTPSARDPLKVWSFYERASALLAEAEPNAAHLALAELERRGLVEAVITQNIDLLHERAGAETSSRCTARSASATLPRCGARYASRRCSRLLEQAERRAARVRRGAEARRRHVRRAAAAEAIDRAFQLAREAQLLLVVGSTLEVYPVAGLPRETLAAGGSSRSSTAGRRRTTRARR